MLKQRQHIETFNFFDIPADVWGAQRQNEKSQLEKHTSDKNKVTHVPKIRGQRSVTEQRCSKKSPDTHLVKIWSYRTQQATN